MTALTVGTRPTAPAITANGAYAARLAPAAVPDGGPRGSGSGTDGAGDGGPAITAAGGTAEGAGPGETAGGPGPDGSPPGGGGRREGGGAAPSGEPSPATAWFAERWTLEGPEPYAVPLPLDQPEEPDSEVQPLADGRVLIRRRVADRHAFSLLYPTGPRTGELPLGAVESACMTLLPPAPTGDRAYALEPGEDTTGVWLVAGGAFGPELITRVPGRCSGGAWLDRTGRMLALDRETGGVTKAVAVDLERGGEVSPLLQIAEESNDRLLLADPDSGLLLIRSDAPGRDRIGWGVLGSSRPVRFPDCLRLADCAVTPFAVQPGQVLMPENCAVALRIDGAAGSAVGVWRPAGRRVHWLHAPEGWLTGTGLLTREGVLRLPYATAAVPCGVVSVPAPPEDPEPPYAHVPFGRGGTCVQAPGTESSGRKPREGGSTPVLCRPVPLQQAPLHQLASPRRVSVGGTRVTAG